MADYTQNKGLELPKSNEHYDVGVANKNNMVIDSELHKLDIKNQSQDNLMATKEALNSEISRATSAENELSNNITNEVNRAIIDEDNISENLTNHKSSTTAHSDIRSLISDLTTRLNALVDSVELLREDVDTLKEERDIQDDAVMD